MKCFVYESQRFSVGLSIDYFSLLPTVSAQWIRSAGHPASEGENPHTEVYNQMMIKEV